MVHGLRELTDPGANWERRMEKQGKGGRDTGHDPAGIVGLGKTVRAEPQFCRSERLGPSCFTLQPCRLWALRSRPTQPLHTERSPPPPSPQFADCLVCPLQSGSRDKVEKQEEAGTGRGARCWGAGHFLPLKPTLLVPFRILCLLLTPTRENTITKSPGAVLPRPGRLHWDSTRLPRPRLVTFSKLHPFCARLFAE